MNIITIYDNMVASRQPYLNQAEDVSKISLPDLNVTGQQFTKKPTSTADLQAVSRPYSNTAAHAIGRLATTLQSLVIPPSTNWFMLDIPTETKLQLQVAEAKGGLQPGTIEGIQSLARQAETMVLEKMAELDLYGKVGDAFRRLLVEGQVLFHVTKDFIRVVPLRCFTVERFNGNIIKVCIKEEYSKDGEDYDLYTLVNYETGKVYQQRSTQRDAKLIAANPKQYIVASSMVRDYEDYATSFATIYYPTIYSINFLSRHIHELAHWCAKNIIAVSPGLNMTVQEFKEKLARGDNVFSCPITPDGRLEGIGFLSAQTKLSDLAALTNELMRQEEMLARAFSLGITSQVRDLSGRERVTAQEILARSMEVDADAQSHAATLMSTFQRPLVDAFLTVLGVQLKMPDGSDTVKPIILAGANLLARTVKVNQLLTSISTIAQLNPEFVRQLNVQALFMEVAQAQGYQSAERFLLPPEAMMPQQQQQGTPMAPENGMTNGGNRQ